MLDRNKNDKLMIFFFRLYMLCLPPYNLIFRYYKIKPLVPRCSNLRDLTVCMLFLFCWVSGNADKNLMTASNLGVCFNTLTLGLKLTSSQTQVSHDITNTEYGFFFSGFLGILTRT